LVKLQFGSVRANSLQTPRTASVLLAGIIALTVGTVGHTYFPGLLAPASAFVAAAGPMVRDFAESAPVAAAANAAAEVGQMASAMIAAKPEVVTREIELQADSSFAEMLQNADVAPDEALAAAAALDKVYSHRKLKAGQDFTLTLNRLGADETIKSIVFQAEPTKEVTISRLETGAYTAKAEITPLERERVAAHGTLSNSLYETGRQAGVPRSVMAAMVRAYSHTVDFQRDLHVGDKFEVLYDQPTSKDGKPVGQGVIIYAALQIGGKVKPLYRVTFADGAVDYFDEKGQSVKRSLLRTPVEGAKMTSGFGMRMHPLLGYSKMHQGIDFGAPTGAPIFAAGSGVVAEVGFKGAYGRYVRIRHNNGQISTAYAHMSRFARGLYQGARVNQGDVIGFVGSSGRATGPHLHYEVHVNGQQVNPLSVNLPTGRVLEGKTLVQFKDGQTRIRREFSTLLTKDNEAEKPATESLPEASLEKASKVAANTRR